MVRTSEAEIGAATSTQGRKLRDSYLKTKALVCAACQKVSAFSLFRVV